MVKDSAWQVRQGAVFGLGHFQEEPDAVIPLIVPLLSDDVPDVDRSAAYALRGLECRSAYNALVANGNGIVGDIIYQAGEAEKARERKFK